MEDYRGFQRKFLKWSEHVESWAGWWSYDGEREYGNSWPSMGEEADKGKAELGSRETIDILIARKEAA